MRWALFRADLAPLPSFRMDSSHRVSSFMEDQPVKIVDQIGHDDFGLCTHDANGAYKQAEWILAIVLGNEQVSGVE